MNEPWKLLLGSSVCLTSLSSIALAGTSAASLQQSTQAKDTTRDNQDAKGPVLNEERVRLRSTRLAKQQAVRPQKALPSGTSQKPSRRTSPALRYLTVRSGDTLWGISRRYGVSLSDLERWNHLSVENTLQIGQKLYLHGPGPAVVHHLVSAPSHVTSRSEQVSTPMVTGILGMQIVDYAKQFIGVPYAWGGESVYGFDCSGLVQFVFGHFGIHVPRTSYEQYNLGTNVYMPDLLPGDLVFFNTNGPGPSHVGIYAGGNQVLAACGNAVQFVSLSLPYWKSHLIGAKRIR